MQLIIEIPYSDRDANYQLDILLKALHNWHQEPSPEDVSQLIKGNPVLIKKSDWFGRDSVQLTLIVKK